MVVSMRMLNLSARHVFAADIGTSCCLLPQIDNCYIILISYWYTDGTDTSDVVNYRT